MNQTYRIVGVFFLMMVRESLCSDLTIYPQQQTRRIKQSENKQWESIIMRPDTTINHICTVATSLNFFIEPPEESVVMRLRARTLILDQPGLIMPQDQLSPMDLSKVYVYSPKGIIVKSVEFHEKFGFEFTVKANESFKITFVDGPPGPLKIFAWELDTNGYSENRHLPAAPFSPQSMQLLTQRIQYFSEYVEELKNYSGLNILSQKNLHQSFEWKAQRYEWYLQLQALAVLGTVWVQLSLIRKLLKRSEGILV